MTRGRLAVDINGLTIHHRLLFLAVARSGNPPWCECRVECRHLVTRELHVHRAEVVFQVLTPLGARDRNNVRSFVQQPRERDLRRRGALSRGQVLHGARGPHVGVEVLALVARIPTPEVALRVFLCAPNGTGQKPATQRREGHDPDPVSYTHLTLPTS